MSEEAAVNLDLFTHLPCHILLQINEEVEQKQIDLVGTAALYHRLDQSLKDLKMEPLFIREQWALFSWRRQFFEEQFPDALWGILMTRTLAFLVCCKFDKVIDLSLRRDLGVKERQAVFEDTFADKFQDDELFKYSILSHHNERFSVTAFCRFDESQVKSQFDELFHETENEYYELNLFESQQDYPLSYDDVTAMVAELCPSRVKYSKTLEEIAMKTILKHGISMEEMSRDLQKKSVKLLRGKISYDNQKDASDNNDMDAYGQDDYDEYNEERYDLELRDKELRVLKRVVRGKGLKIIRRARFHMFVHMDA